MKLFVLIDCQIKNKNNRKAKGYKQRELSIMPTQPLPSMAATSIEPIQQQQQDEITSSNSILLFLRYNAKISARTDFQF